jgi:hypothetical protein
MLASWNGLSQLQRNISVSTTPLCLTHFCSCNPFLLRVLPLNSLSRPGTWGTSLTLTCPLSPSPFSPEVDHFHFIPPLLGSHHLSLDGHSGPNSCPCHCPACSLPFFTPSKSDLFKMKFRCVRLMGFWLRYLVLIMHCVSLGCFIKQHFPNKFDHRTWDSWTISWQQYFAGQNLGTIF